MCRLEGDLVGERPPVQAGEQSRRRTTADAAPEQENAPIQSPAFRRRTITKLTANCVFHLSPPLADPVAAPNWRGF
jgi:hypothetical protein